jgi:hypothetical protein
MPIRKLTQKELEAWLGEGIVMPGPKRGSPATSSGEKASENIETNDPEWDAFMAYENAIGRLAADDINRLETEEDGIRAGQLRVLKAKHQTRSFQKQSRSSVATSQPPSLVASDETRLLRLCVEDLKNQVQEWLGFDIPDEGTEDYEIWQMKISLIEQIESISDVYGLCEGGEFSLPSVLEDERGE